MKKTLIERIEVGAGGAASIEFTSIPQDGVDLLVVVSARGPAIIRGTFNSDTTLGNYNTVYLQGYGSGVDTNLDTTANYINLGISNNTSTTANTFDNRSIYISNYTSATDKSISVDTVNENNATSAYQYIIAGSYETTSAITSIQVNAISGNYVQYTTASLYKISA